MNSTVDLVSDAAQRLPYNNLRHTNFYEVFYLPTVQPARLF